jgi:hypothetical protein
MTDERQDSEPQTNAFSPVFLDLLEQLDEVETAHGAELAGPWKVVATETGYALLRVYEAITDGDQPEAVFSDLPSALLFFAVLPSLGRPPLVVMDSSPRDGWYTLTSEGLAVGGLRLFDESFVQAAHVAGCLTRAPLSLAALLLASGPQAILEVGRILRRLLKPGTDGKSWLSLAEFPPH